MIFSAVRVLVVPAFTLVLLVPGQGQGPRKTAIERWEEAYAEYAAGDFEVVRRVFTARPPVPSRDELEKFLRSWAKDWTRAKAAFLLDVSMELPPRFVVPAPPARFATPGGTKRDLIFLGQRFVAARPAKFGVNAADDRFELLWHELAVSLVGPDQIDDYLDDIWNRVHGDTVPALVMARAYRRILKCCEWLYGSAELKEMDDAVKWLDRAATFPDMKLEALTWATQVRLFAGRAQEAVPAMRDAAALADSAAQGRGDREVAYWFHIVRGRMFDALEQYGSAAASFDGALAIFPDAQTPAVARAATLMRSGQRQAAAALSERIFGPEFDGPDPWLNMQLMAARYVPARREALRKAIK
jgi:tetratricopeptide (TPR) repeat protein